MKWQNVIARDERVLGLLHERLIGQVNAVAAEDISCGISGT